MSEPEGAVISMAQGMGSYIVLRFYEPMEITVGGNATVTGENACIIITPHTGRSYSAIRGGFTNDYVSFLADDEFISRCKLPLNRVFYLNDPRQLSSCIGFITWALTDVLYDHEKLIMEQVDSMLQYIGDNIVSEVSDAQQAMHERYAELRKRVQADPFVWSVERMASEMHLSRNHFSMSYRKIFGISPRDDLSEMVMKEAQRMLKQTDNRVSEIAERCGYANTENFIRAFRKAVGITPLAYRKGK